ncbi:MetQ/NlpA family ABC transporter substrate-binding protein [Oceanobacillus sp. CFH 90083]|uniref:MetQ/NlpA family ABC transporter substrate-binding protein n=1 Tax=Oceanobacillus sp. CFH 90083 TaxID=2592336 RepID=UPI00128DF656|nr:MetQ/NlpA family ABC transporter substrate-binding protein [Oceanobacillus sp. CFH 90083]
MNKKLLIAFVSLILITLAACGSSDADATDNGETTHVKIGVNGADGVQWPILQEKAAAEGIEIELIEFADYTLPNDALAQGDIDINAYQHIAFLGQYVVESGNELVPIGSTVLAPIGLYSEEIDDVSEIEEGAAIAIPDDPSNQARALRLLESADLITLSDSFGMFGDPSQIEENPLNLDIVPMVAQQTVHVLPDVTASIINNGVAGQAGLSPGEDPIYIESADGEATHPYVNIIAAREEDKNNEVYQRIVELYQEEDIEQAIDDDTNGGSFLVKLTQEELDKAFEALKAE